MRQEIDVYFVSNQALSIQHGALLISLGTQRVQPPVREHEIAPLGLEHAHDVLWLQFIGLYGPVEYALLLTL